MCLRVVCVALVLAMLMVMHLIFGLLVMQMALGVLVLLVLVLLWHVLNTDPLNGESTGHEIILYLSAVERMQDGSGNASTDRNA